VSSFSWPSIHPSLTFSCSRKEAYFFFFPFFSWPVGFPERPFSRTILHEPPLPFLKHWALKCCPHSIFSFFFSKKQPGPLTSIGLLPLLHRTSLSLRDTLSGPFFPSFIFSTVPPLLSLPTFQNFNFFRVSCPLSFLRSQKSSLTEFATFMSSSFFCSGYFPLVLPFSVLVSLRGAPVVF